MFTLQKLRPFSLKIAREVYIMFVQNAEINHKIIEATMEVLFHA